MLIQQIARTSKFDQEKLRRISRTASFRYKVYEIPKRGGGTRKIAHPSRELKALQRWLSKVVFARLPIHDSATAYRTGAGIRENAERHRATKFTNRYDFQNFFPSFSRERVLEFLEIRAKELGMALEEEDFEFVGNIVCRHNKLTIGAPSSPILTNAMMFDFDKRVHESCHSQGLVYTRYADDLFVSAFEPNQLDGVMQEILLAKREVPYLSLRLNRQKTAYLSKKFSRRVAGVIITPDHKLSIGRDRKREIKALVHQWANGVLEAERVFYMRGLVAFARDIEPNFESSLRTKYGNELIDGILRHLDKDAEGQTPYN